MKCANMLFTLSKNKYLFENAEHFDLAETKIAVIDYISVSIETKLFFRSHFAIAILVSFWFFWPFKKLNELWKKGEFQMAQSTVYFWWYYIRDLWRKYYTKFILFLLQSFEKFMMMIKERDWTNEIGGPEENNTHHYFVLNSVKIAILDAMALKWVNDTVKNRWPFVEGKMKIIIHQIPSYYMIA